jgi:hypothetical protein
MKRWGVFTNFYNGITIDGREVFLDDYDTKDAALEEAIHNCILILEQFRRYDVFCECITEEKEPYEKYKAIVVYNPASVTIYEKRGANSVPIRKWTCKEIYDIDLKDCKTISFEGKIGLVVTL